MRLKPKQYLKKSAFLASTSWPDAEQCTGKYAQRFQNLCWLAASIAFGTLMFVGAVKSVSAEEITYSDAIGTRPTNWVDELTLPQFDPMLGELSKVEVNLTSGVEGVAGYENLGPNTVIVTMVHRAIVELGLPNAGELAYPQSIFSTTLTPFDGEFDQAGTSGGERKLSASTTVTRTYINPEDLAPFIGQGVVSIPITATGSSESDGPGNFAILLRSSASGSVLTINYIFDSPNIEIETYTNGVDADDPNDPSVPHIGIGEPLTWTYEVHNTGEIPFAPEDMVVTDSVLGVTPTWNPDSDDGDGLLTPGEIWIYEYVTTAIDLSSRPLGLPIAGGCDPGDTSYTLPTYGNVGSVTVQEYDLFDSDPTHHCNQLERHLQLRKLIDGIHVESNRAANVPEYEPGDSIMWTYEIENLGPGSYEFDELSVTDSDLAVNPAFDPTSDLGADLILSAGETWVFTASGTAQNLDRPQPGTTIVQGCGPEEADDRRPAYQNVASVVADEHVVVDISYYCQSRKTMLSIEKLTNGFNADSADDADVPRIAPGDSVTWHYQVENTGSNIVTLSDVKVTDSQAGATPLFVASSDDGDDGLLSPGEVWLFETESIAQPLHLPIDTIKIVDGCRSTPGGLPREVYQNIGTVTLGPESWSDPSHYCNPPEPEISVEKLTNDVDADDPDMAGIPEIEPGDIVVWTYVVHNDGNVPFAEEDVRVVDNHPGIIPLLDPHSDLDGDRILSAGEIWRYEASGIAADLSAPPSDIQTVEGCEPINPSPLTEAYMNQVTVNVPGSVATDISHYCNPPAPSIEIEKMTNTLDADSPDDPVMPIVAIGDPLTWTYIVRNMGNVTYREAEVIVTDSDPLVTPMRLPEFDENNDALLSPGELWYYIAFGTAQDLGSPAPGTVVIQGCDPDTTGIKRLTYQNIATVETGDASDSDPSHYCLSAERRLALRKFTNGSDVSAPNDPTVPQLLPGEPIEWLYLVDNIGTEPIPLSELVLTDSDPQATPFFDPNSDAKADNILSPGETWRYIARGIAQNLAAPSAGTTTLSGCTSSESPEPRPTYQNVAVVKAGSAAASDTSYYCNLREGLEFQKLTNGWDLDSPNAPDVPVLFPRDTVTWTYIVTNTGDVTYRSAEVVVIDSDPAAIPELLLTSDDNDDRLLSPGEVWLYNAVGMARSLKPTNNNITVVPGCKGQEDSETRWTYENTGAVRIGGLADRDKSHYCNPIPILDFELEKYTNGQDADDVNGRDVPVVIPTTQETRSADSSVKWTYVITNTGTVEIFRSEIKLVESDTTLYPYLDVSTDTYRDGILSIGESWTYLAEALPLYLGERAGDTRVVSGCLGALGSENLAYRNVITVSIGGIEKSDPSHYCNLAPTGLDIVEESTLWTPEIFVPFVPN